MSEQPAPPQYRYPETPTERVEWHVRGTPAPFTPYSSDAPDPVRDGLLKGWREHMRPE